MSNLPEDNPYAAPTSLEANSVVEPVSAPPLRPFVSPLGLYKATKTLLILFAVILIAGIASGALQLSFLQNTGNYSTSDFERRAVANDTREQMVAITHLVLFLVTAIVSLTLLHRLRSNVDSFGATGLDSTPGWSVGWFFVPIAHLWKPYQATTQTWQASVAPDNWQSAQRPSVFPTWWGLWLVSAMIDQISVRMPAQSIPELIILTWMNLASAVLMLIVTGCFLKVLSRITFAQLQTHKRISEQSDQMATADPWAR